MKKKSIPLPHLKLGQSGSKLRRAPETFLDCFSSNGFQLFLRRSRDKYQVNFWFPLVPRRHADCVLNLLRCRNSRSRWSSSPPSLNCRPCDDQRSPTVEWSLDTTGQVNNSPSLNLWAIKEATDPEISSNTWAFCVASPNNPKTFSYWGI